MGRALAFGDEFGIELSADESGAVEWVREFFGPALRPAECAADARVRVISSAGAYQELRDAQPLDVAERPCFAFDQTMLCLPSWEADGALLAGDHDRACVLALRNPGAELIGDSASRRWRFTLVLLIQELIATRLRGRQLELHASTIEVGGRAMLIAGPKRAGKTTLSFHLLRSGLVRWLGNDRAFVHATPGAVAVHAVPSAVRVRTPTAEQFPELRAGIPEIDRPFLYSVAELADPPGARPPQGKALMLSPAQVARQFGVERGATATLGTLVFPEVDPGAEGWRVEPLNREEVGSRIWANLFGDAANRRLPTMFEDLDGGLSSPAREDADRVAAGTAGFRAILGRGAYDDPAFAAAFLEATAGSR